MTLAGEATHFAGFPKERSRALDQSAMESFGLPGILLMEHASIGAADLALKILDDPEFSQGARAARVFCGPGNNGGDGYAMARHLLNAGIDVEVWDVVDPLRAPSESDAMKLWLNAS